MPVIPIERIDDPRLAPYRDLPRSNLTRYSGLFVVEGGLLVERLLASPFPVASVLVDARRMHLVPSGLPAGVPVYATPEGLVEQIIGFNFHRGILACGRRRESLVSWDALADTGAPSTLVVCADVQDPTNMGGILRNCAAFAVDAVVINRRCADPFSRRVLRVSMGASLRLPLIEVCDTHSGLAHLRGPLGFQLVAAVLDDEAEQLEQAARPRRMAVLFGNEGHGLPDELVRLCHRKVTLAMGHNTDSLNAGVATGVFLYHFSRVARFSSG